ncbi:TetR/AcrR family transcriptional regulator [Novosphingobium malaysiense]|uniref:HTH tetR-type domain-containing protein n=1 Tax=Novosphingobium malaysiense TaxID=1348853 RepID=A0A0B1ZD34_9SPHN|nr:TetR/AcrR family transcriptional regulator [Novosphingobium malaysiense]KHK88964.1 hypothetical protein LK12_23000 [Novosphingobium malaysiense]
MKLLTIPSSDRLIQAVLELWEAEGSASMSARKISLAANTPASSIYHHFGSMEQLVVRAQEAALAGASAWADDILRQLSMLPDDLSAFAGFFAATVDDWSYNQRQLAFAWREGQLLAARSGFCRTTDQQWASLWTTFWRTSAGKFGLGDQRIILERVFESESLLHMMHWERLVDRAGLDEFAKGLTAWVTGAAIPPSPWRDAARTQAACSMPEMPQRDEAATAIMKAAATVLERHGVAGLTHRAVASASGLTHGVVLHKFPTKSALLSVAFEAVYLLHSEPPSTLDETRALPHGDASVLDLVACSISRTVGKLGVEELILAVARDHSLKQFGAQLRYLRGRGSKAALETIVGGRRQIGHLEAALFSSFGSSQTRSYAVISSENMEQRIRAELNLVEACVLNANAAAVQG